MFCKYCGAKLEEGSKFCGSCGHKVEMINDTVKNVKIEEPLKSPNKNEQNSIVETLKGIINTKWFAWIMLFAFTPIGLILFWKNKIHSTAARVVITLFFGAAFINAWTNNSVSKALYSASDSFDSYADKIDGSSKNGNSKSYTSSKTVSYQKVNIDDLEKQLKQNAARAQQNWQGKNIEISGPLDVIDANGEYFSVKGTGFWHDIHCTIMNEKQKQFIISKNKGDNLIVRGKITRVGEIAGYRMDVTEIK